MKVLKILIPIVVLIIISLLVFNNVTEPKILKIGLVTDLSGKNSSLGLSARNGLELAIEEINSIGGIKKHIIQLIVRDHEGSKDICKIATGALIEQGVKVIISPILSGMAMSVIESVGIRDVLIIGPTVSTDMLTGIDDNFLRVTAPASLQGKKIAEVSINNSDKRVVLILDKKNSAYASGVSQGYKESISGKDIDIIKTFEFTQNKDVDNLIPELLELEPDAIFFISNGIDSGKIVQNYAKEKTLPRLYGSSWVKASDVHEYGGSRVEGMILADSLVNEVPTESEIEFYDKYKNRFGMDANTISIYFYESVYLYKKGVEVSGSFETSEIKEAIFSLDVIDGITENYSLDRYGDGVRSIILYIIRGNRYEFYNKQ